MWLTADEALARLGSKPQSLYANVSRGRIRAKPDPADKRRSLYQSEDVDRLAARARGRRSAQAVASGTMNWGEPVLPSAISTVNWAEPQSPRNWTAFGRHSAAAAAAAPTARISAASSNRNRSVP